MLGQSDPKSDGNPPGAGAGSGLVAELTWGLPCGITPPSRPAPPAACGAFSFSGGRSGVRPRDPSRPSDLRAGPAGLHRGPGALADRGGRRSAISISGRASRSTCSGTPIRRWSRRWRTRRGSSGTSPTSTASPSRRRWRRGWSSTLSRIRCSSPIPAPRRWSWRSRWRASISRRRASRSAIGSSPSRGRFTGAPSRRSRPPTRPR